jgi:type I restriction enzyme R subunit
VSAYAGAAIWLATARDKSTRSFGLRAVATLRDALPNASFIGFTGTPIEAINKNTKQIFDFIDIYNI